MGRYAATRSNTSISTTADFMTLVSLSARRCYVYLVEFAGMGTASAANEVIVARSSGGTTGGGAITPGARGGEQAGGGGAVSTTPPHTASEGKRISHGLHGRVVGWSRGHVSGGRPACLVRWTMASITRVLAQAADGLVSLSYVYDDINLRVPSFRVLNQTPRPGLGRRGYSPPGRTC